jgi:hypothetical protein
MVSAFIGIASLTLASTCAVATAAASIYGDPAAAAQYWQ